MHAIFCTTACWLCLACAANRDCAPVATEVQNWTSLAIQGEMVDCNIPAAYRLPAVGRVSIDQERFAIRTDATGRPLATLNQALPQASYQTQPAPSANRGFSLT